MTLRISLVTDSADIACVRALFREYADSLGVPLDFQDFETEVTNLPGAYAAPAGGLWLARFDGAPCGCVAVRPLDGAATCELKRLFVQPEVRGQAVGLTLTQVAIDWARASGYRAMRLDTMPQMSRAKALYTSLGFREIPPYRYNPVAGTAFMELHLTSVE